MLDQNVTTLLSNLIIAASTLVAVFLTNRRSLEVEKFRINHEAEQERLKRENEVIEEVYQTLVTAHDLCVRLAYDVRNLKTDHVDTVGRIKEISSTTQRIAMLIRLHLPLLKEEVKEYEDDITNYWNRLGGYYAARDRLSSVSGPFIEEGLLTAENKYQKSLQTLLTKLETIVK